jgi:RHS repeat-associated protein
MLVVYIDNQSIGKDVWFDNLVVDNYTSSVLEEDHYYPFGLTLNMTPNNLPQDQPLKYQGIPLEKHFGLETYETFFRGLDPQLGRFNSIDPKGEMDYSTSLYASMGNSPSGNIDPLGDSYSGPLASTHTDKNGKVIEVFDDGDLGVYMHEDNADGSTPTQAQIGKRHEKSTSAGGIKMGETEFWDEFVNFNTRKPEGYLIYSDDPNQSWNVLVDWGHNLSNSQDLSITMEQSKGYGVLDLKRNADWTISPGTDVDPVMTGRKLNGKYASARSAGNYLAGLNGVTGTIQGHRISGADYMKLAGAYQVGKLTGLNAIDVLVMGKSYGPAPYYGEENYSGRRILQGINAGLRELKSKRK